MMLQQQPLLQEEKLVESIIKNYEMKCTQLKDQLEKCGGITFSELSIEGKKNLQSLIRTAKLMDLKDLQTSSYSMAIIDLYHTHNQIEDELDQHRNELSNLEKMKVKALGEIQQLDSLEKKLLHKIFQQSPETYLSMERITQDLKAKHHRYQSQLEEMKEMLERNGFSEQEEDSIVHHDIISLHQKLEKLKEDNQNVQSKLDAYHDLPLNYDLARAKMELAEKQLASLEKEFDKAIRTIL